MSLLYHVDDKAELISLLKESLARHGITTINFTKTDDCLKAMGEMEPDLVLFSTSVAAALKTGQDLRKKARAKDLPFLLLAKSETEEVSQGLATIAPAEILAKPFSVEDVVKKILTLTQKKFVKIEKKELLDSFNFSDQSFLRYGLNLSDIFDTYPFSLSGKQYAVLAPRGVVLKNMQADSLADLSTQIVLFENKTMGWERITWQALNEQMGIQHGGIEGIGGEEKILVYYADDQPELIEIVSDYLRLEGIEVIGFHDGKACLEALQEHIPRMVLLDVKMEGMSGVEVLERIRGDEKLKQIPVILITGQRTRETVVSAKKYQADDFLVKPFTEKDLTSRVKNHLKGRQQNKVKDLTGCGSISQIFENLETSDPDFLRNLLRVEHIFNAFPNQRHDAAFCYLVPKYMTLRKLRDTPIEELDCILLVFEKSRGFWQRAFVRDVLKPESAPTAKAS